MSKSDNKRSVFTTIGAYTSFMESTKLPEPHDTYTSINDTKNDTVAFLMDIIKAIVGTDGLQDTIGKLFTDFIDGAEPELKTALKNQFIKFNAGDNLSSTSFNDGIRVKAKDIDIYGILKKSNNTTDDLLHDGTTPCFNNTAYNAILNTETEISYNNLLINYNSITDEFIFKPNGSTTTIGAWMGSYIDDAVIINKKQFLTNVMNSFYGTITANQNKTVEEVYQELQTAKLIENLINGDDSFELNQNDYDELLQKAQNLINGIVYYNMGCGLIAASLSLSGLTNFISQVSGITTDSHTAANAIAATMDESLESNTDIATANKESIRDNFFQRLIKAFNMALTQLCTTSPQVRALQAIMSAIENNGIVQIGKAKDDLKKFKVFIKCMIREAIKMIVKFIFNITMAFIAAWLAPIIKKLIQEKIIQYMGTLKSLIA